MNFNLISWFYRSNSKEEILNFGLKTLRDKYLDTDYTSRKLKRRHSSLTVKTIESYIHECEKANSFGVDWIQNAATKHEKIRNLIDDKRVRQQFDTLMKEQFPWIDRFNLASMYNWTCYGLLFDD